MGPIINPQPDITGTEPWRAWTQCPHVNKEKEDISASTNINKPAADRCELGLLEQKKTCDQTVCSDQVLPGDQVLKTEANTDDEQLHGYVSFESTEKDESSSEERQTSTSNAVLTSNSDLNTEGEKIDENSDEEYQSAEEGTSLPVKDCVTSEPQTMCNSSSDDSTKDSCLNKVEDQVADCSECQKMRRQKEKPFLNKNKSCGKFVWNKCLLQGFEGAVHPDWILHIVNGFVGQSGILLFH